MRCTVRVDGSPFTLNGVTSSFAELNCGSVGFRCVAFHALLAAGVEKSSTSRGNACVSQSNCLSCITDSTGASQSEPVYAHVKSRKLKKKRWRTKLNRWSYLYLKVVCLTFLVRFFKSYREIDTVQCKNPFIVTEKYV